MTTRERRQPFSPCTPPRRRGTPGCSSTPSPRARLYARPLVEAVAVGTVPRNQLTADLVRQLRSPQGPDACRPPHRDLGRREGDESGYDRQWNGETVVLGRRIPAGRCTRRAGWCSTRSIAQCHHLFDTGGEVGPDITGANRGDLDYLLQNILFPNAVIPNEYRATTVETRTGEPSPEW